VITTEDADRTYSNLLKTELFGPASIERPSPTHTSSAPTLPIRPPTQPLSSTPFNHHPSGSNGDFVLPPLPAHSPSTPRTHPVGAFAAVGPRHSRSTPIIGDPPVTPTKRRVLDFSSPTSAFKSSPTSRTGASPGNISLGQKSSTGLGRGLDDMMHEKYSLSPMGRDSQKLLIGSRKPARYISKTPFKVLDAPDLAVSRQGTC
jgi:cell division cycle 20-like protein 1 (cofactor of APC complex)